MRIDVVLRTENTQEGNTWFSRTGVEPDIQLHCDREVWITLGKPNHILLTIQPIDEDTRD
jgi:hypothetical protein